MKKEEIRELSNDELEKRIREEKLLYQKMRFNHVVSTLENPMQLRMARKNIARLSTELRSRQLSAAKNGKNQ